MLRCILVSTLGVSLLAGCENDSEECERARMELSRDWDSVKASAKKRKEGGVDVVSWAAIEKKAETLRSAFETRQVTWDSADDAQQFVVTRISSLKAENELGLKTFRNTLDRAVRTQEQFANECR